MRVDQDPVFVVLELLVGVAAIACIVASLIAFRKVRRTIRKERQRVRDFHARERRD